MKVTKISEKWELEDGKYKIHITNEQGVCEITDYSDNDNFWFQNTNSEKTRKKWATVAKLITRATKLMETL